MTTTRRAPTRGRLALLTLLVPGALLLARAAHADVLVEGYKGVSHELRLEGLDQHPELAFLLYPVYMNQGAAYVSSDQPLPYIKFSSPRLYAVPRAKAVDRTQVDADWLKANAVAVSWHTFEQHGQIPDSRPEDRIRTVFRVARIEGKKLVIEGVREELFDRTGKLLERRVPAVDESDPDARPGRPSGAPPAPVDPRGSWVPGRLGGGLFAALPVLAGLGLLGAAWRRRGTAGALALTLALGLGGAGGARADIPVDPPSRFVTLEDEPVPTWALAGGAAAASLLALGAIVIVRRRGAAK